MSRQLFENILISDDKFDKIFNERFYEGDIKLDPLSRLYMEVDRNLPPRRKRAVARDRSKRWIGGVIPFSIDKKLRKFFKILVTKTIAFVFRNKWDRII